jgi:hypothetical protein
MGAGHKVLGIGTDGSLRTQDFAGLKKKKI